MRSIVPSREQKLVSWVLWPGLFVAATLLFLSEDVELRPSQAVLAYLLMVVGASASGGHVLGGVLVLASYAAFHLAIMPPYVEQRYFGGSAWIILVAFGLVAFAINELVRRWRNEAERAMQRADEVERLAAEREKLMRDAQHAEALREADRLKGALLASISHDLRTPLTSIRALASRPGGPTSHDLATIQEEAERLTTLVEAVLDWSRVQGGALPIRPEFNTADDLLDAARRAAGGAIEGHPLRVQLPDRGVLAGTFDLVLSVRIVANLLENAAKYTPPGTPIELRADRVDGAMRVTVRDHGGGIASDELPIIFEPFVRGARTAPDTAGLGLGLAIAREFARAQGGNLDATNRAEGGAEFTLTLPLARVSGDMNRISGSNVQITAEQPVPAS
ncbi:MAG: PAS domain-containing sensor histidine kinase [Gemmatimonadetes bacterium]|nr:PAS domain-containing sensor histidine kinase [Gemmatimonadota bacterium]